MEPGVLGGHGDPSWGSRAFSDQSHPHPKASSAFSMLWRHGPPQDQEQELQGHWDLGRAGLAGTPPFPSEGAVCRSHWAEALGSPPLPVGPASWCLPCGPYLRSALLSCFSGALCRARVMKPSLSRAVRVQPSWDFLPCPCVDSVTPVLRARGTACLPSPTFPAWSVPHFQPGAAPTSADLMYFHAASGPSASLSSSLSTKAPSLPLGACLPDRGGPWLFGPPLGLCGGLLEAWLSGSCVGCRCALGLLVARPGLWGQQ